MRIPLWAPPSARSLQAYGLESSRASCMLARYPGAGARYARHRDALHQGERGTARRLTAVYYLNSGWETEARMPGPGFFEAKLMCRKRKTPEVEVFAMFCFRVICLVSPELGECPLLGILGVQGLHEIGILRW